MLFTRLSLANGLRLVVHANPCGQAHHEKVLVVITSIDHRTVSTSPNTLSDVDQLESATNLDHAGELVTQLCTDIEADIELFVGAVDRFGRATNDSFDCGSLTGSVVEVNSSAFWEKVCWKFAPQKTRKSVEKTYRSRARKNRKPNCGPIHSFSV